MSKKDFFSGHAKLYATFRPTYPKELYQFIFEHIREFSTAWDCATGNGQVAQHLVQRFTKVFATDISKQQLDNAVKADNIIYSLQPAENTDFPNQSFDLITVGQALHWFDLDKFYTEVKRVAKPDALLAVWGYALCTVSPEIDKHFLHFYHHIVGPYWDSARRMVEEEYRTVPFPFREIKTPTFKIQVEWTLEEFGGYLITWSATQKFIKDKNYDPVPGVMKVIQPYWHEKEKITFPVFLKLGRV
jgi:ubiquinone/menaquinone biosynthesis C-methylase UbiE